MLEEKKAVSRKYLIIPSVWHHYRIVSMHKFYIKEFLLAGMLCAGCGFVYERYMNLLKPL